MGLIKDFEMRRWLSYPGGPNGTSGDRRSKREGGVKTGGNGADITMSLCSTKLSLDVGRGLGQIPLDFLERSSYANL